jgi:phosphate transport system permease protein
MVALAGIVTLLLVAVLVISALIAILGNLLRARKLANLGFTVFCIGGATLAIVALAAILASLLANGFSGINLAVFTQDTPAPGSQGGLRNAILGSIAMCFAGMLIAVVVGILAGTWLAEYAGRTRWTSAYGSVVRFINDVLLSAPSILVGLFIYTVLVARGVPLLSFISLGQFSGIAGAIALALLAVPVVTRTTEDVLRLQSRQLRESGVALGAPLWVTIRSILWKAASGGMITGALLAFARISGETAPLLFTALNNQFNGLNWNPADAFGLNGPTANIPVVIFNYALSAYDDWRRLAWVGALLIAAAVLGINILVRVLSAEPKRS